MLEQHNFFRLFVDEENWITGFSGYIRYMKQDGVWGGQPELQALSEMYRRPIEIYTDSTSPENLLGGEFNHLPNRPPIRLRYRRSHYNSITSANQLAFLENEPDAGTIQNM